MEKKNRSIIKAISWRMLGSLDTMIVSYFITGSFSLAASIGIVEIFTKLLLYYGHERLWNKITLGRNVSPVRSREKQEQPETILDLR